MYEHMKKETCDVILLYDSGYIKNKLK
jgi:hypothetical protein